MRWLGGQLTAALLAVACAFPPAQAQTQPPQTAIQTILVVDRERVLRDSAPGRALAAAVQEQRLALQSASAEAEKAMEAEETEIDQIRDRLTPQQFEERLRDFDQRVRQVRRDSQQASQALHARINDARRDLEQSLNLVLRDILAERGASVLLNAQTVIMAREEIDITAEAVDRFSTKSFQFDFSPAATGDGG